MHRLGLLALGASLLALAGCVNLAPKYQRPPPLIPASSWPANGGAANAVSAAQLGWKQFFLDPRLRHVVALALANNQNLRIAALDIEKSREEYRQAGAALFPTVDAAASATIARSGGAYESGNSLSGNVAHGSGVSKSESVELGFSSFELDLFGKLRNEKQAALEALLSSVASRRSTRISLIGEVASDWLTLAADKELLALARRTLKSQQVNYRLVTARHRYGIATGSDVANARSAIESAREDIATDLAQIAQDRDALNLVVGVAVPAGDLPGDRVPAHPVVTGLPAGVPSTVLENRPDVLAAEYTLRGDYASIGAARAAFFPVISLTAATGFATQGLSDLFKGSNYAWSFSPQITVPVFDAGSNRAALEITKVQRQIDIANYEQTIQTAFREVADALAIRETIHQQVQAQKALVAARRRAYRLSLASYRVGTSSYLDTLVEQQSLYSAEQTDVSKRLSQQTNLVTLYKVLGGGGFARTGAAGPGS